VAPGAREVNRHTVQSVFCPNRKIFIVLIAATARPGSEKSRFVKFVFVTRRSPPLRGM